MQSICSASPKDMSQASSPLKRKREAEAKESNEEQDATTVSKETTKEEEDSSEETEEQKEESVEQLEKEEAALFDDLFLFMLAMFAWNASVFPDCDRWIVAAVKGKKFKAKKNETDEQTGQRLLDLLKKDKHTMHVCLDGLEEEEPICVNLEEIRTGLKNWIRHARRCTGDCIFMRNMMAARDIEGIKDELRGTERQSDVISQIYSVWNSKY